MVDGPSPDSRPREHPRWPLVAVSRYMPPDCLSVCLWGLFMHLYVGISVACVSQGSAQSTGSVNVGS